MSWDLVMKKVRKPVNVFIGGGHFLLIVQIFWPLWINSCPKNTSSVKNSSPLSPNPFVFSSMHCDVLIFHVRLFGDNLDYFGLFCVQIEDFLNFIWKKNSEPNKFSRIPINTFISYLRFFHLPVKVTLHMISGNYYTCICNYCKISFTKST